MLLSEVLFHYLRKCSGYTEIHIKIVNHEEYYCCSLVRIKGPEKDRWIMLLLLFSLDILWFLWSHFTSFYEDFVLSAGCISSPCSVAFTISSSK